MIDKETLKAALEAKLKELEARAEDIEEDLSSKPDSDWEDNAIEAEDDEVLARIGDLTLKDIREVRLVLNRIEKGTYGICASCGQTISEQRLEALPHTTKCVNCA